MFPKQAANSLVTETSQYFVFFCRSVYYAIFAKRLIINVLRLILVILFFIAFLNITYWARHTWATIAAGLDIPKETISEALGHEIGSSVTSIYIDFNRQKVDDANRKVIDYINSVGSWIRLKQIIDSMTGLFND
ncbi:integrase [Bacteroides fragilis]